MLLRRLVIPGILAVNPFDDKYRTLLYFEEHTTQILSQHPDGDELHAAKEKDHAHQ